MSEDLEFLVSAEIFVSTVAGAALRKASTSSPPFLTPVD
jgi:hypothetical protein